MVISGLVPFLDTLVEPVVCTDREHRIMYSNPVFSAAWQLPDGATPKQRPPDDDGTVVFELCDHSGSSSEVTLDMTMIPDAHGRALVYLGRVRNGDDDAVAELRQAAAVITARLGAIGDHTTVSTTWCDEVEDRVRTLSSREREIFDLIIDGNRVCTVAKQLYLSEHTVRNYLKRIYGKLDVHSLGELRELTARSSTG